MPNRSPCPHLILASRSPRRALLLREAGFTFEQADPPFHDPPQPDNDHPGSPASLAADLARQKALSLRGHVGDNALILAADTICVGTDGDLIGQPADRDDARRMIEHFANNTHAVITGVALLIDGMDQPDTFADEARVALGALNNVQLDEYLDSDQWRGKAGGYNLFDRQAAGWPLTVEGDDTTVVGLPMRRLLPALATLNVHPGKP
jgi:nucleoside triphosphate pyrophosphatase